MTVSKFCDETFQLVICGAAYVHAATVDTSSVAADAVVVVVVVKW